MIGTYFWTACKLGPLFFVKLLTRRIRSETVERMERTEQIEAAAEEGRRSCSEPAIDFATFSFVNGTVGCIGKSKIESVSGFDGSTNFLPFVGLPSCRKGVVGRRGTLVVAYGAPLACAW